MGELVRKIDRSSIVLLKNVDGGNSELVLIGSDVALHMLRDPMSSQIRVGRMTFGSRLGIRVSV
jgi:hypothetical protein